MIQVVVMKINIFFSLNVMKSHEKKNLKVCMNPVSLLTLEHQRLIILEKISTFFSPRFSYSLQRVVCFNLGFLFFQINCSGWYIRT